MEGWEGVVGGRTVRAADEEIDIPAKHHQTHDVIVYDCSRVSAHLSVPDFTNNWHAGMDIIQDVA